MIGRYAADETNEINTLLIHVFGLNISKTTIVNAVWKKKFIKHVKYILSFGLNIKMRIIAKIKKPIDLTNLFMIDSPL